MATSKKLLQAAAGTAYGGAGGLNVEDVFSTYLYTGTGSAQTITNGIDLSGEGGLVWMKARSTAESNCLQDTDGTGVGNVLLTNSNSQMIAVSGTHLSAFNSNGFSIGTSTDINRSGTTMASWTFRKASKFFDVVTYTGDGTTNRKISHNLGSVPGFYMVKRLDDSTGWSGYHRGANGGTNPEQYVVSISDNGIEAVATYWNDTAPTATEFTINNQTPINASGGTYVAYLFAHNDGDGDFGPTGDQDIIKCGSYTGTGSAADIDVGFEPQWLLVKKTSALGNWFIVDNMRGFTTGGVDARLFAQTSSAENSTEDWVDITPTGFRTKITDTYSSGDYIYIAIRRGPMAVPTDATDVFAIDTAGGTSPSPPLYNLGKPVDFALTRAINTSSTWNVTDRLRQGYRFRLPNTDAESVLSSAQFDYQEGHTTGSTADTNYYSWMWKRAPNYFDAVAYTGAGGIQTINHNLGVKPEAILIKQRTGTTNWVWWFDAFGDNQTFIIGNLGNATITNTTYFNNTAPTDTQITLGFHTNVSGTSSTNYIAYLFASLDGVSKVGSYTGNSSTQNIDCGFSSGARFVLIKRTDDISDWFVFDTVRGIVTGAFDPYLELNTTQQNADAASGLGGNFIEPYSGGFALNNNSMTNGLNMEYIFYAIA